MKAFKINDNYITFFYRTSLSDRTRLILSTKESELFRYLQSSK